MAKSALNFLSVGNSVDKPTLVLKDVALFTNVVRCRPGLELMHLSRFLLATFTINSMNLLLQACKGLDVVSKYISVDNCFKI